MDKELKQIYQDCIKNAVYHQVTGLFFGNSHPEQMTLAGLKWIQCDYQPVKKCQNEVMPG